MYQWIDPDSGTTQLSGKPPTWYRSHEQGPRVFVFEKGELVDDTQRQVSEVERDRLRMQAFLIAEENKAEAKEKLLEAKRLKATFDQKQASAARTMETNLDEDNDIRPEVAKVENTASETEAAKIDEMRALISEWESLRAQNARELINRKASSSE